MSLLTPRQQDMVYIWNQLQPIEADGPEQTLVVWAPLACFYIGLICLFAVCAECMLMCKSYSNRVFVPAAYDNL